MPLKRFLHIIQKNNRHGRNSSKVFRRGLSHKKAFSCTGYVSIINKLIYFMHQLSWITK